MHLSSEKVWNLNLSFISRYSWFICFTGFHYQNVEKGSQMWILSKSVSTIIIDEIWTGKPYNLIGLFRRKVNFTGRKNFLWRILRQIIPFLNFLVQPIIQLHHLSAWYLHLSSVWWKTNDQVPSSGTQNFSDILGEKDS